MDTRKPAVVWFRRDLRVDDNPAWAAASASHEEVVALFVIEPRLMATATDRRRDVLISHLAALDDRLRAMGGSLTIRNGPASEAVPAVVSECDAARVYVNADFSPFSVARDAAVARAAGLPVATFHGLTVHEPGEILTKAGGLSRVFTPFHRTWTATDPAPWPRPGSGRPVALSGVELERPVEDDPLGGGEAGAWKRLQSWLERVDDYDQTRDMLWLDGTSKLSADLKFGSIAARTVLEVVGSSTPGRAAFVRQLAWRDWWAHQVAERPDLPDRSLRPEFDSVEWRGDEAGFERWCNGRTGYPIVDAGMRQLVATGWIHNRVRMICASFLVKDLLIDWRRGERFFRHHLIDADVAQNAGNWQWVAGTGPDAAPFFRVFNPTTQARKFDPDGSYTRRWVPELAALPAPGIQEPAALGPLDLAAANVTLGRSYPEPIVQHSEARARTLAAYEAART